MTSTTTRRADRTVYSLCAACGARVPVQHLSKTTGQCPQCKRRASAAKERGGYSWAKMPDGRSAVETGSGVYIVGDDGCTCPDWMYRCSWNGGHCKHQLALWARQREEGGTE